MTAPWRWVRGWWVGGDELWRCVICCVNRYECTRTHTHTRTHNTHTHTTCSTDLFCIEHCHCHWVACWEWVGEASSFLSACPGTRCHPTWCVPSSSDKEWSRGTTANVSCLLCLPHSCLCEAYDACMHMHIHTHTIRADTHTCAHTHTHTHTHTRRYMY